MPFVSETDLILNPDGSAYHLNILSGDVADTIILVGDQDRVAEISKHFDSIELRKTKREFITHTGYIGKKRITVISTGISTDNIDIVINELDALVNIDLNTREIKHDLKSLTFIRVGTSGIVQPEIPVDTLLVSEAAFGLDPLMHYYEQDLSDDQLHMLGAFARALPIGYAPYLAFADEGLLDTLGKGIMRGITITTPGFYAPQGRQVRAHNKMPDLLNAITTFEYHGKKITNMEMETAGIYGMAHALGHKAISFNVLLANRVTQVFSQQPAEIMNHFIEEVIGRIADL